MMEVEMAHPSSNSDEMEVGGKQVAHPSEFEEDSMKVIREAKEAKLKAASPVSIRYDIDALWLVISDLDRALFRDGDKEYYDKPRDERPYDLNPFDIQEITQVYYMLTRVARDSFGLNKAPAELVDMLDKLQLLCELTEAVANHCIAIIVNPDGTTQGNDLASEGSGGDDD